MNEEKQETGLTTRHAQVSMFLNEQRFEFAQRIGKMLSASTMIPEHYRNNLGNCLIALNLAERLGIDVFGLMQTSYVIHGRPGFEAKLLIAIFNARTQIFNPPLRWEFKGDFPYGEDSGARAYAVDKETNEPLYGEWIDWQMVKAEEWDKDKPKKTGGFIKSKWQTMPGQMFRYRSASFFINAYEPGLKMGIQTVDELEDMVIDITPQREIKAPTDTGEAKENPYEIKNGFTPVEEVKGPPRGEKRDKPEEGTEGKEDWTCEICGYPCQSERGYKRHRTMSHKTPENGDKKGGENHEAEGPTNQDMESRSPEVTSPPPNGEEEPQEGMTQDDFISECVRLSEEENGSGNKFKIVLQKIMITKFQKINGEPCRNLNDIQPFDWNRFLDLANAELEEFKNA